MSSPRRAAKDALERAAKAARGSRPAVPTEKTSTKIAVADAKRVSAALERSIADGKLDMLPAETLQALIAAACRLYAARREAGEQFTPVGAQCARRHRRDGDGERATSRRRSRRLRARHVARLDRAVSRDRHCEEQRDEAIQLFRKPLDCFASLAMTR